MGKKKPIFKVIVAGGRKFNDYNLLKNKLDNILSEKRKTHQIYIISGMASLGRKECRKAARQTTRGRG